MSWRDDTDSSETRGGTQDGNGGSKSAGGGSSGGGDGSNYTYRGVPGSNDIGNWNTGGPVVGTGSFARGIMSALRGSAIRAPTRPMGGIPPVAPPVFSPPPVYPPVSGPPTRVDLNPATLAPLTVPNYQSTFPARPGVSPSIGVANQDQSRLDGYGGGLMDSGFGSSSGGYGGGGGGGW